MHLFKNVSEDFGYFEKSIIRKGMVAFHDYREGFPGVGEFVNSLIYAKSAPYRKIHQAQSLIVLEKVSLRYLVISLTSRPEHYR
jgi:hypothetical protein